jgi:hypothetical protein
MVCRVASDCEVSGGEVRGARDGAPGQDAEGEGAGEPVVGGGVAGLQPPGVLDRVRAGGPTSPPAPPSRKSSA